MLLVNRLGEIPFYDKLYRISDYLLIQRNKKVSAAPQPFYSSELVNRLKSYTVHIINITFITVTAVTFSDVNVTTVTVTRVTLMTVTVISVSVTASRILNNISKY